MNRPLSTALCQAGPMSLALVLLSACDAPARGPAAGADVAVSSDPETELSDAGSVETQDVGVPVSATAPASDADPFMDLERARTACRDGDFQTFFDVLIWSEPARMAYSGPIIVLTRYMPDRRRAVRREVTPDDYRVFPIRMEDFYRRPSAAVREAGEDEYVELAFNQSQSEAFAVSWTRVRYDGHTEGGDDLGRALTPDGRPLPEGYPADGTLRFTPHDGCWRLVADERYER